MLRPPSLKSVPYYPVTAGVSIAACVVTVMWRVQHQDIGSFIMDYHVWADWQLWRPLACTLPHVNFLHLAFNLYWIWTFGTLVERVFGHIKCLAIYVLLAFGSMLTDFTVSLGGVGLSGLVYGLWGMLMMLERRDARFADAVDRRTNQLFAVWFFICIGLTVTGIMPVANVAHGAGAVIGILLGLAIGGDTAMKWAGRTALTALLILIFLGGTVFWPYVNLSKYAAGEIEQVAAIELTKNHASRSVQLLQIAVHKRNASARLWYNLGVAYENAKRYKDASAAFKHAAEMPDANETIKNAAKIGEEQSHVLMLNR